jgi:hypothetical protein
LKVLLLFILGLASVLYVALMYRLLLRVKKSKRKQFFKIQVYFTLVLLVISGAVLFLNAERIGLMMNREVPEALTPGSPAPERSNRCACTWDSMRLTRDDYADKHRPAAESLANDVLISDEATLNTQLAKGKLVPFKIDRGMRLQKLTHSEPFLHPTAAKTYQELALRFSDALIETPEHDALIVVSSVTRTSLQQAEILRRYPFGATRGTSTHSYGASIDLLFVETAGDCYRARKALEGVINAMQSEGKLYVCPESKCIHLTAAKES